MRNLKLLQTEEVTDADWDVYVEVKQNAEQYINTTFELDTDWVVDYEGFEEFMF